VVYPVFRIQICTSKASLNLGGMLQRFFAELSITMQNNYDVVLNCFQSLLDIYALKVFLIESVSCNTGVKSSEARAQL